MNLLIINDFGIKGGGTENRVKTLIDYLMKQGIFEEFHVLHKQKDNFSNDKRIILHTCPKGHIASYSFTKQLILKNDIDFVQAHNMMDLTPAPLLAAKSLKKPVVWFAHDYWVICTLRNFINPYNAMNDKLCPKAHGGICFRCRKRPKTFLKLWLWKKMINKSDLAIATSKIMVDLYEKQGVLNNQWKVISPWVDPSILKKDSPLKIKRNQDILFVGSLIDFKGAWILTKALRYVLDEVPDARVLFIGGDQERDSIYRARIESIAKHYKIMDNLIFLGKRDKIYIKKALSNSGVCVFPSVSMESFGLVWAEAMAVGCPVIASSIGSVPEYINKKNKNGLVFEPRDHEQLAKNIILLLKNPMLSIDIGKNGRKYAAEHFDIRSSGRKIIKIYLSMLK